MAEPAPSSTFPRRPLLALCALALLGGWAAAAQADMVVDSNEPVVISDDILERTTAVESAADAPASAGTAQGNHGHGNNADGVDSSNPGQGQGGPNGASDPSCGSGGCVDDEAGGGGSAMSANQGGNP